MRGMLRPHRPRAGVTVGWLLAALAVIVVVVIVAILLWPAGPEPGPDEAPPAAEEELPGEEAPDEDAEAAELEPQEDAEADAAPDEEAAEAEAPPEDEAGDDEEASADADASADEEAGPGPVDARVDGAEDVELQADARNREIEAGGALADATRRAVTAMAEAETELRRLQAAREGDEAAPEAEPLQVEGPSADAEARVQEPSTAALPDVARLQEAANGAARGERPDGAAEVSLDGADAREQAPPSDQRTRTVDVRDVTGAVGAVEAARDRGQRVEPSEFSEAAAPSIDLGEVEGRQADAEGRVRTISLDPRAADGAIEQTRQALERAQFSSRPAAPSNP